MPGQRLTVGETVELLQKANTKEERKVILEKHNSVGLRSLLKINFDPNLTFCVEGKIQYRLLDAPSGMGYTTINAEADRLYLFIKGRRKLDEDRRRRLWIQLLESLDPLEAETLDLAMHKKLNCGVTKKLVDEVFPNLIKAKEKNKEETEKEKPKKKRGRPKKTEKSESD